MYKVMSSEQLKEHNKMLLLQKQEEIIKKDPEKVSFSNYIADLSDDIDYLISNKYLFESIPDIEHEIDELESGFENIGKEVETLNDGLEGIGKEIASNKNDILVIKNNITISEKKLSDKIEQKIEGVYKTTSEIKNELNLLKDNDRKPKVEHIIEKIELPKDLARLSDIPSLDEYAKKEEVYDKKETYNKQEVYNKREIDGKLQNTGGGKRYTEIKDDITDGYFTRSSEKIQEEISGIDSSVTLLDISANSITEPNSVYNLTSGIPVNFKSSDGNALLYLDETNERIGVGTSSPAHRLDIYGTGSTGGVNTNISYNITPVVAPTATFSLTAVAGAGLQIGTYYYAVAYYTAIGDTSASARVGVTTTSGNQQVSITNIPVSTDPTVIGRKIYRGKVGEGGSYGGLIATIANNTSTTYTDTTPDSSLTGSIFTRAIYGKPNLTSKYFSINGTRSLIADATGLTTLGYEAGLNSTVAPQTTLIGSGAGKNITYENGNTLIGYYSGFQISGGLQNVAVGPSTLQSTTSGSYNVAFGQNSLYSNTVGSHNFAAGYYAGNGNTGSGNIYLGSYSGEGTTYSGSYNINIGYNADPVSTSSNYQLNIGNFIYGTTSGTKALGINTTTPDRMLEVLDTSNPQLRLTHTDGSVYADFQTDGNGNVVLSPSGGKVSIGAVAISSGTGGALQVTGQSNTIYGIFNAISSGYAYHTYKYNGTVIGYIGQGNGLVSGGSTTDFGWRSENALVFAAGGAVERMRISSTGSTIFAGTVRLKNYTVATLPAGTQGDTAFVTDALAPTYLTTVVGGGAIVTPVFYNGTNRVAH